MSGDLSTGPIEALETKSLPPTYLRADVTFIVEKTPPLQPTFTEVACTARAAAVPRACRGHG